MGFCPKIVIAIVIAIADSNNIYSNFVQIIIFLYLSLGNDLLKHNFQAKILLFLAKQNSYSHISREIIISFSPFL